MRTNANALNQVFVVNLGGDRVRSIINAADFMLMLFFLMAVGFVPVQEPLFYQKSGAVFALPTLGSCVLLLLARFMARFAHYHEEFNRKRIRHVLTILIVLNMISLAFALTVWLSGVSVSQLYLLPSSFLTSIGFLTLAGYHWFDSYRISSKKIEVRYDYLLLLSSLPFLFGLTGQIFSIPQFVGISADPRIGISIPTIFMLGYFGFTALFENKKSFVRNFFELNRTNKLLLGQMLLNIYFPFVLLAVIFKFCLDQGEVNFSNEIIYLELGMLVYVCGVGFHSFFTLQSLSSNNFVTKRICSYSKQVYDNDEWENVEVYLRKNYGMQFSHGISSSEYAKRMKKLHKKAG